MPRLLSSALVLLLCQSGYAQKDLRGNSEPPMPLGFKAPVRAEIDPETGAHLPPKQPPTELPAKMTPGVGDAKSAAAVPSPTQPPAPSQLPTKTTAQPPIPSPQQPPGPEEAPPSPSSPLGSLMDPFEYDPRGRRDPFLPPSVNVEAPLAQNGEHGPVLELQLFELAKLKLLGVIWNVSRPRAIVADPGGKVHTIGLNDKLGNHNGYVAVIREGEIVVVETNDFEGRLISSATVMRLHK